MNVHVFACLDVNWYVEPDCFSVCWLYVKSCICKGAFVSMLIRERPFSWTRISPEMYAADARLVRRTNVMINRSFFIFI